MHSRSLFSLVGALALMAALPSGRVPSASPPAIETYRTVEVASFSAPTFARPGPTQELSALVAPMTRMTLTTTTLERIAPVKGLDLFMADEPLRRQAVKAEARGDRTYFDTIDTSARFAERWRMTLGDHGRIPLRI